MRIRLIKCFAIVSFVSLTGFFAFLNVSPVKVMASNDGDGAALYTKHNCAMCHTKTATKFFDPAKSDADLVQTILKGKKAEKPPNMPAYEAKPMTEAEAQSLVTYMKSLRAPAN